jgi:CHAT domain-containing protein
MSAPNIENGSDPNQPLPKRMPIGMPQSVEEAFKLVMRMANPSWSGPLVVGNPTGDLPAAETEARDIAALLGVKPLIGSEVAVETVLSALLEAPLIHLAAHAWFDETDGLESAIVVADGTISAKELISSYSQAELVVLSSCEGGVANRVIGGEVAGLAHTLLRTGAKTIVAALWPVDDDATAFLMTAFYRTRLSGVDEPTALAQAMRMTSEQPLWRHPYFWSGFVLMQGE